MPLFFHITFFYLKSFIPSIYFIYSEYYNFKYLKTSKSIFFHKKNYKMSRRANQKPKEKQSSTSSTQEELIIDSEDTYKDLDNISYIHPSHLNMIKSLTSNLEFQ